MSEPRAESLPVRQIRESTRALLAQGKSDEAWELILAALEAVVAKNRDQELLILQLRRERIGRKSERLDPKQIQLMFEAMAAQTPAAPETAIDSDGEARQDAQLDREIEAAESAQPKPEGKKRSAGRGWKAQGIRQEVHRVEPDAVDQQCTCGRSKVRIGKDVTHRLEFVPGHFVSHEYHLGKYACPVCKEGVTTAPAPAQVLERSAVGASVLSRIVIAKYIDHAPLHRICRGFAREGVQIPVSTMADWIAGVGTLAVPLVERLELRVLAAGIVRTDATGLLVLDPNSPDHVVRGSMWAYVGDDRDVVFRYAPTGEGQTGPWTFLAGFERYIQADAATVFDRLFNGEVADAVELGCWSHARRKLVALEDTDCRVAYPLKLIARLYRIEHLADARGVTPEGRKDLRQERSIAVLEKLRGWYSATRASEPPASDLAKAAGYPLNHWKALTRFVDDGRISLDNNLCEQQLRDIALGRKNYLFAGSHDAARRAAALYSLTRTCLRYGLPPLAYFTDILTRLAAGGLVGESLDELLPHRWRPASK